MPRGSNAKRQRQYEHIRDNEREEAGRDGDLEMNKEQLRRAVDARK